MKTYGIYHLRWQISAWLMLFPMLYLESLGMPLWANLMIGQAIGATIFWKIDNWIFKGDK